MHQSALVLFSGGQDSTTCLAHALARYARVETIGFDYGQRHRVELAQRLVVLRELRARFPAWAARLGEDHLLDLAVLGQVSETALTRDTAIAMQAGGLPNTFVPGRNLLFLTLAAALAYRRGHSVIVTGVCETDFSGYPDCRDDTMKALQVALSLGMDQRFLIDTPLMWLDKAATWQLAHDLTPGQPAQLAQNIMNAARLDRGACQSKTVATPDLVASITPPALSVGATGTVQVQVSNNGLTPSTNGQIVINLPAGLALDTSPPPLSGCIRNPPSQVTCTLDSIAHGTSLALSIPVHATAVTAPGAQISAAISGNTGELAPQQGNNRATAASTVTAAPAPAAPVAVPTLHAWSLGALAALLGAAGLRRQRKGARQG